MGKRVRARKLIKVEEWQDESVECPENVLTGWRELNPFADFDLTTWCRYHSLVRCRAIVELRSDAAFGVLSALNLCCVRVFNFRVTRHWTQHSQRNFVPSAATAQGGS